MKSNYLITNNIFILTLEEVDLYDSNFDIKLLSLLKEKQIKKLIIDLNKIKILKVDDIKRIERLIKLLKLNDIFSIICNINPNSISVIVHFIDKINFRATLNVQRALDEFNDN